MSGKPTYRTPRGKEHVSDHLPACPRCGDLLEPGAVFCQACGCYVVVRVKEKS